MKSPRGKKQLGAGSPKPVERDDVRFTVSFAGTVMEKMERQMTLKGFNNNVSAYLADCVRRDEERTLEMEALSRIAGGSGTADQLVLVAAKQIMKRLAKATGHEPKGAMELIAEVQAHELPPREITGFHPTVHVEM